MREPRGQREARGRETRSRDGMTHDPAAGAEAATHISRALRASPFAWGDENREAHFFSVVARLPLVCDFIARVAPLASPDGRSSSSVGAHRVRVQVRGSVLVIQDVDGAARIVGTVSLAQATLRFVRKGVVAVIPSGTIVSSSIVSPPASSTPSAMHLCTERALSANAVSLSTDSASAASMASLFIDPVNKQQQRRWWRPALRRGKDTKGSPSMQESLRERNSRPAPRGFVLELEDQRRFPTVVDALSAAVTVPRPPSLTRFEIVRPLRMGRTTSSYLVCDTQSGELLSMKLVRRADVAASDVMRRVVDERAALERIRGHPFVIDLRHSFMTDTLIVFIFEHCLGGNLEHQLRLRRHGFREREATAVIAQIVLAIEHVHRAGSAVHRDLKPENVLIDSQGWIRLAGFGLCRILDSTLASGVVGMNMRRSEAVARLDAATDRAERHSSLVGNRKVNRMSLAEQMCRATSEMVGHSRRKGSVQPLAPLISDRPEKMRRSERGTRARIEYEEISSSISDADSKLWTSPNRMSSAVTDAPWRQNSGLEERRDGTVDGRHDNRSHPPRNHSDVEGQMGQHRRSRVALKPESSSTVTEFELGSGNLPGGPLPRAATLMDENGYRSPEMVLPGRNGSNGYGGCADMWSLGVLAHYVMTGALPFATDANVPLQQAPPFGKRPEVTLSSEIPSLEARDFVEGLLCEDPKERLGCGFEGMDEVRMHPWLRSIDWSDISRREGGYALKMLGDNRRRPADEDEAIEAARDISSFSGASGVLGLGNENELMPGPGTSMDLKRMSTRGLGSRRKSTASVRNPGRVRAILSARRRRSTVSPATNLANNVTGGHNPPGDGDMFGFAFSSSRPGYQPGRVGSPRATNTVGVSSPARRSSFATSRRLSNGDHKVRRLSRMGRSGRAVANSSFGGRRRSMEGNSTSGRGSLENLTSGSKKSIRTRRASIERAKSGDFMTIDPGDVEIPFRKSLDMAAASRRQSVV